MSSRNGRNPIQSYSKKYQKIYHELMDHPRTGIGHPEALVGGNSILYSRHITAHDRIIYEIHDEVITVLVLDVEGHYNDKLLSPYST